MATVRRALLSVSPLLDGKVTVPKHRLPDGPMLPEMAYEISTTSSCSTATPA